MLSLRRPSLAAVQAFRQSQQKLDLTYAAVGATAGTPPEDYIVDKVRVKVGEGGAAYAAARAALHRWEHFRLGWIEAPQPRAAIRTGEVAVIAARTFGMWWLNAARIVYVVEEEAAMSQQKSAGLPSEGSGVVSRFGFAYGTLPRHAESGEERFLVEWDRTTDEVWY
jgi:uncharacterized protein (UPF0548 family)